jgi:L-fuconate dehydratase
MDDATYRPPADRAIERVDHLHEHFTDPAVVRAGYYLAPRKPGFSH